MKRSVLVGLVAAAVLLGGCSSEEGNYLRCESGTTDEQLGEKLKGVTNLVRLVLKSTRVTDAGLVHLKGNHGLWSLDLSNTQVTDAGLVYLKGLSKLEVLSLFDTKVTDAGLEHLKGLSNLEIL